MGSQILQNPSDPDATYREKEGKQNRGYTANIVETVESMEKNRGANSAYNRWGL